MEMTAQNLAAYLSGLQGIDLRFLADGVTRAIQGEHAFPPVHRLIAHINEARHGAAAAHREQERTLAATVGTVQCLTCMDAGFVRKDVPVGHADFGRAFACPVCGGKAASTRDSRATIQAHIEREHDKRDRIRAAHGLPPCGTVGTPERTKPIPPPPDFANNAAIPETLGEQQIAENKARIAREVAGLSGKMRQMQDREGRR